MRRTYILILFLLCISLVSATVCNPKTFYGKFTIENIPANAVSMTLMNNNNGEILYDKTRDDGAYGFYLDRYLSCHNDNDKYTLAYCIADTRCLQETKLINAFVGVKGIDINVNRINPGSLPPYVIYGKVFIDNSLISSGTVIIENLKTGQSLIADINANGEYSSNLANMVGGYNTGDKIRLKYSSSLHEFTVSGDKYNYIFNIITSAETPSGNGGGGGGGTTGPGVIKPEEPEEEEIPTEPSPEDREEEVIGGIEEELPEEIKINWSIISLIALILILIGIGFYYLKRKG